MNDNSFKNSLRKHYFFLFIFLGYIISFILFGNFTLFYIDKLDNVEVLYDDLGSDASLRAIEKFNPDVCFHLAAQSSVVISVEDPLLDFEHNLLQPIKLLQKLMHSL